MDKKNVSQLACALENVAQQYSATDLEVKKLLESLADLIEKAKDGLITKPVDHVPGEYWFQERELSKYPDLESAYSKFKIAVTIESDERYNDLKAWAEKRRDEVFGKK